MPLTRPPAPPVPPTRTAPPVAPRPMAPPPQRAAAPQLMAGGQAPTTTRVVQGPAGRPPTAPPVAASKPMPVAQQQAVLPGAAKLPTISDDEENGFPVFISTNMVRAIRSAQLKFYQVGTAYFESQMKGAPTVKTEARPSVSAPSVATAQKAPTPAAPGPEKRPVGRPPGRPPASPPTQQAPVPVQRATPAPPVAAQSTGEVPSAYDLNGMTRKDLVELAKSMGLETQGVKGDDLRVMIANAGGSSVASEPVTESAGQAEEGPSTNEQYMEVRATVNMALLDANIEKFGDMIDPNSADPSALKCGGDCIRCPNPGNFPHAADQVASCYTELHTDLGLEQEYPVAA